jgi:uncharacterized protein DUF1684
MAPGGYLDAEMPKDAKAVLDSNKAYNPYCAFNPYFSCPIPPKQNTRVAHPEPAVEGYPGLTDGNFKEHLDSRKDTKAIRR